MITKRQDYLILFSMVVVGGSYIYTPNRGDLVIKKNSDPKTNKKPLSLLAMRKVHVLTLGITGLS